MNRKQFLFRLLGLGAVASIVPKLKTKPKELESPVNIATNKPVTIELTGRIRGRDIKISQKKYKRML